MRTISEKIKQSFQDSDYRHVYAEGVLNSLIATQIKVLREQRGWVQEDLANLTGMKQSRISLLEDVNYSSWTLSTLKRLARAFDVRLKVSFEEFGSILMDLERTDRASLERQSFDQDLAFRELPVGEAVTNHGQTRDLVIPDPVTSTWRIVKTEIMDRGITVVEGAVVGNPVPRKPAQSDDYALGSGFYSTEPVSALKLKTGGSYVRPIESSSTG